MSGLHSTTTTRKAIVFGLAGLAVVMLLIVLQQGASVPPGSVLGAGGGGGSGAGAEGAGSQAPRVANPPSPSGPDTAGAGAPEPTDAVPLPAVARDPEAFVGRLLRCRVTSVSAPEPWSSPRGGPEGDWSAWRLTLFCGGPGGGLRLSALFERETLSALPDVGLHTLAGLQLLGRGPGGELLARFVRVLAFPRVGDDALRGLPDLIGALIGTEPPEGEVRCRVRGVPTLLAPDDLGPASRVLLGVSSARAPTGAGARARGEGSVAGAVVELPCVDRRGGTLPVLVAFSPARLDQVLRVGEGTRLRIGLRGRAGGRLVGSFAAIVSGAVEPPAGDLRAVLLRPARHVGVAVRCRSMGVPEALALEAGEEDVAGRLGPVAGRKAWVVCAQPGAPPVHMSLFFPRGGEHHLLAIGRGTRLRVRVLGVAPGRVLGLFERVEAGAVPASAQARDLRRLALLTGHLEGRTFRCVLLRDPPSAAGDAPVGEGPATGRGRGAPRAEVEGSAHPLPRRPTPLRCRDPLRPTAGQRVLLRAEPRLQGALHAGDRLELELAGFAHNAPLARLIRVISARDGRGAGGRGPSGRRSGPSARQAAPSPP